MPEGQIPRKEAVDVIDLAFYNAGCEQPRGARRVVVLVRRVLRRILRPIFSRQVEILQHLCDRLDRQDEERQVLRKDLDEVTRRDDQLALQTQAAMSFGWDYVAMVRRLAVLEDRVEALVAHAEAEQGPSRSKVA